MPASNGKERVLLAAGERVLDVQPKLGARVRLLAAGDVNKNDPNDARSVAVAALRSPGIREVQPDDHAAVLKIWSKRYRDLGRTRTQVVCRLHAVLGELIPGGVPRVITTARAGRGRDSPRRLTRKAEPGASIPVRPDRRFLRAGALRVTDSRPGGTALPRHLVAPAGGVTAGVLSRRRGWGRSRSLRAEPGPR